MDLLQLRWEGSVDFPVSPLGRPPGSPHGDTGKLKRGSSSPILVQLTGQAGHEPSDWPIKPFSRMLRLEWRNVLRAFKTSSEVETSSSDVFGFEIIVVSVSWHQLPWTVDTSKSVLLATVEPLIYFQ